MIRNLAVFGNTIVLLVLMYLIVVNGVPSEIEVVLIVLGFAFLGFLNLFVILGLEQKDSIISLWLQVRKKRLREQLEE